MIAGKQIFGAALTGIVFFFVMWAMDEFGRDRITVNAIFAVICGVITYFVEVWLERRRAVRGPRPSFRDIISRIRAIIRQN